VGDRLLYQRAQPAWQRLNARCPSVSRSCLAGGGHLRKQRAQVVQGGDEAAVGLAEAQRAKLAKEQIQAVAHLDQERQVTDLLLCVVGAPSCQPRVRTGVRDGARVGVLEAVGELLELVGEQMPIAGVRHRRRSMAELGLDRLTLAPWAMSRLAQVCRRWWNRKVTTRSAYFTLGRGR
jgi:hypothetical protein